MKAEFVRAQYCDSLIRKIDGLRRNDRFCDVDIHVDGKDFTCHRLILSAASSYFDNMFNGTFKESTEKKVTLEGIESDVFERILDFIYTGDADFVHSSNVYDIICAADFYGLPFVLEFCTEFVKENLNALAEEILKIYSLVHRTGYVQLIKLLSGHIRQNFRYFSKRPEYCELTYDSLTKVLTLMEPGTSPPVAQDVFFEGIHIWISHQVFSTPTERKMCLDGLVGKIDFTKLSVEYTRYRMKRSLEEQTPSRSKIFKKAAVTSTVDDLFLHAYVLRIGRKEYKKGVSIFTAYRERSMNITPGQFTWVYSGELKSPIDFMRNVYIDGRVYSLRHYECDNDGSLQTFSSGSSVLMYPSSTLKPPPCIMDFFDMCGARNNIYVYEKYAPIETENSGFSSEELERGMFVYKRDIDRWFPMPCPETRHVMDACMTCDDEGIAYLIGGVNSNGSVRVYDPRTAKWSALSPTNGVYENAVCCAYGKKLFVAGGEDYYTTMVETYESGNWLRLKDLTEPTSNRFLMNWYPQDGDPPKLITFNQTLERKSSILCKHLFLNESDWYSMPSLFEAVRNSKLAFTDLEILDMIHDRVH